MGSLPVLVTQAARLCFTGETPVPRTNKGGQAAPGISFHPAMKIILAVTLAIFAAAGEVRGQRIWREGFEGAEPSWRRASSDASYKIDRHERVRGSAQGDSHGGFSSEWIRFSARSGSYVHFDHDIGKAAVIDELAPSVWVRADRPGVRLLGRVVMPRTRDPASGKPLVVLVRGEQYTRTGHWQKLVIDDIPRKLQHEAKMLRARTKTSVDWREAYVDRVVLNVYSGRGTTNIWIDDLEVAGYVDRQVDLADRSQPTPALPMRSRHDAVRQDGDQQHGQVPASRRVQIRGSLILVDGRPVFPRMIQYQGEPLAWLKSLGFSAVRLSHPASEKLLAEARRNGLWLVCPPPVGFEQPSQIKPSSQIDPSYDVVLAWDFGPNLTTDDLDAVRRLADQLRAAEGHVGRPIVGSPVSDLRSYSRILSVLDIGRLPLGTSLPLDQLARWYQLRPRLARPGSMIWTAVQTQLATPNDSFAAAFSGRRVAPSADPQQVRLMAYLAISSGSRGLSFQSLSRLDARDPQTRLRAMSLELLNIELSLLEPWAAASRFVTSSASNDPNVSASVAQDDRSRLLLALRMSEGERFVVGSSPGGPVSIVAAGLSHSSQAYRITPVGLPPVRRRRVTGGTLVSFDSLDRVAAAVLTGDATVLHSLQSKVRRSAARAAKLRRDIAALKLSTAEDIAAQLARQQHLVPQANQWLRQAREALRQCDQQLVTDAPPSALQRAYELAGVALRSIHRLERQQWQQAVAKIGSPVAAPEAIRFSTLPQFWQWHDRLSTSSLGTNVLAAGDFENLDQMRRAGWSYERSQRPGVRSEVDLASAAGPSGGLSLRMSAWSVDPKVTPALLSAPPITVSSAPAEVLAGQLVRIHGRVMVPLGVKSSVDGLMIVDSLGGEPLALRFGQSTTWREFTIYRRANRSGTMRVSFVLTGLGEAWIDDVTIRPVGR